MNRHTYKHTHIHTHIHTTSTKHSKAHQEPQPRLYEHIHTYTHTYVYTYTHTHTHTYNIDRTSKSTSRASTTVIRTHNHTHIHTYTQIRTTSTEHPRASTTVIWTHKHQHTHTHIFTQMHTTLTEHPRAHQESQQWLRQRIAQRKSRIHKCSRVIRGSPHHHARRLGSYHLMPWPKMHQSTSWVCWLLCVYVCVETSMTHECAGFICLSVPVCLSSCQSQLELELECIHTYTHAYIDHRSTCHHCCRRTAPISRHPWCARVRNNVRRYIQPWG